jgi:glutamate carboxypeptidase
MKAGLVTGVWALRALRALNLPHPTVTFLFNGDEEFGSPKSRPYIEKAARDCAAALVLEPGVGWDVKTERKGVGTFTITTSGIEAHAGNDPAAGASAVHALAEIISRFVDKADPAAGTTINIGTIDGGTARNVIAGQAGCLVDIRIRQQDEADRIDEVLAGLRASDPRVTVRVDGGWSRPPMRLTPASQDLFDLANDVATDLRAPLEPISVGGGSDANYIAALGVPVLDGLGCSGAGAHARHEHVIVDDIPDRIALVAGVLHRMAESTEGPQRPLTRTSVRISRSATETVARSDRPAAAISSSRRRQRLAAASVVAIQSRTCSRPLLPGQLARITSAVIAEWTACRSSRNAALARAGQRSSRGRSRIRPRSQSSRRYSPSAKWTAATSPTGRSVERATEVMSRAEMRSGDVRTDLASSSGTPASM